MSSKLVLMHSFLTSIIFVHSAHVSVKILTILGASYFFHTITITAAPSIGHQGFSYAPVTISKLLNLTTFINHL